MTENQTDSLTDTLDKTAANNDILQPIPSDKGGVNNWWAMFIVLLVLFADQASKFYILNILALPQIEKVEISSIFDLTMVWNYGVSFGALRANSEIERWGLVVLSLVISGIFLGWMLKTKNKLTVFALGMVIGGALGNMIDRIRFGAVADFLDFSGLFFPWVFNIADAGVVIGAGLLLIQMIFTPEDDAPKNKPKNKDDKNLKNNDA